MLTIMKLIKQHETTASAGSKRKHGFGAEDNDI